MHTCNTRYQEQLKQSAFKIRFNNCIILYDVGLQVSLVRQMLCCLEGVHLSQSGALLLLLIDKFLRTPQLTVARQCDMMACRRIEVLMAEGKEVSRVWADGEQTVPCIE